MTLHELDPFLRFAATVSLDAGEHAHIVRDCRLILPRTGSCTVTCGAETFSLTEGCLFYAAAGSRYLLKNDHAVTLDILNFDLVWREDAETQPLPPLSPAEAAGIPLPTPTAVEDAPFLSSYLYLPAAPDFAAPIREIEDEWAIGRPYGRELCGTLLKRCLLLLCARDKHGEDTTGVVETVMRYIRENYTQDLTNRELASLTGYHEYYLNRLFAKHTGLSMHRYLLRVRLAAAKARLLTTDEPVSAVGEAAGFQSSAYFSDYFRKNEGYTPTEYRKTFKNT